MQHLNPRIEGLVPSIMTGIGYLMFSGERMRESRNSMLFIVPSGLEIFEQDAINRLSYLYPDADFSISEQGIVIASTSGIDQRKLNEELRYTLYRSKIRAEGVANRSTLFSAVFGK